MDEEDSRHINSIIKKLQRSNIKDGNVGRVVKNEHSDSASKIKVRNKSILTPSGFNRHEISPYRKRTNMPNSNIKTIQHSRSDATIVDYPMASKV